MSSSASHHHQLRLAGHTPADVEARRMEQARLAIVKENRIAAHAPGIEPGFVQQIDPRDPRWVLAMQTQARLQGTVLQPTHRDALLKSGRKLGLRPFEANLVIAIVQDRARAGNRARDAGPMLTLVRGTDDRAEHLKPAVWPKWFAALAAAAAIAAVLIRWLAG